MKQTKITGQLKTNLIEAGRDWNELAEDRMCSGSYMDNVINGVP